VTIVRECLALVCIAMNFLFKCENESMCTESIGRSFGSEKFKDDEESLFSPGYGGFSLQE
jgi:hypothetical protein